MAWLRAPIALFLLALVAIGAVTTAAVVMRGVVRRSDDALERAALDLGDAERLRSLRERVSRKTRAFLFTGEQRYLHELREAEDASRSLLATRRAAAGRRRSESCSTDSTSRRSRAASRPTGSSRTGDPAPWPTR